MLVRESPHHPARRHPAGNRVAAIPLREACDGSDPATTDPRATMLARPRIAFERHDPPDEAVRSLLAAMLASLPLLGCPHESYAPQRGMHSMASAPKLI